MAKKQDATKGNTRVIIGAKTPPAVRRAIEEIAREEDRTLSNMAAQLLQESPRVQSKLREFQVA
jgi:hypothetical protein